jgi:hypothetical protein
VHSGARVDEISIEKKYDAFLGRKLIIYNFCWDQFGSPSRLKKKVILEKKCLSHFFLEIGP